jgi:hypothetical protein
VAAVDQPLALECKLLQEMVVLEVVLLVIPALLNPVVMEIHPA